MLLPSFASSFEVALKHPTKGFLFTGGVTGEPDILKGICPVRGRVCAIFLLVSLTERWRRSIPLCKSSARGPTCRGIEGWNDGDWSQNTRKISQEQACPAF
jgi:hypothetical protein